MPMYHVGQTFNNNNNNNRQTIAAPRQYNSQNGLNFGAPPRNNNFQVDGLPSELDQIGLSQSLGGGNGFLSNGQQIRVKKMYHVQKEIVSDPTKNVPLPPTPPPCECENCFNQKSQNSHRHSSNRHSNDCECADCGTNYPKANRQSVRNHSHHNSISEDCDCDDCIGPQPLRGNRQRDTRPREIRQRSNKFSHSISEDCDCEDCVGKMIPKTHRHRNKSYNSQSSTHSINCDCEDCVGPSYRKVTHHRSPDRKSKNVPHSQGDDCDCHACSPRKNCKCNDCIEIGHGSNCVCVDCRVDTQKKKSVNQVMGRNDRNNRSEQGQRNRDFGNDGDRNKEHQNVPRNRNTDWFDGAVSEIPTHETPFAYDTTRRNTYGAPPLLPPQRSVYSSASDIGRNGSVFNVHLKVNKSL
jgi:hypothetical protein